MFSRKTLFVVGAGGSKEVGLPIGDELTGMIAQKVDFYFERGQELVRGDHQIVEALRRLQTDRGKGPSVNEFLGAGRMIASAMPQAISIDNFLHTHSADENLVFTGKMGIAACILEAEARSTIYYDRSHAQKIEFRGLKDSWHNTFFKMLTANVLRGDLDGIFDNVAFITFNYDRCIEHYVSQSLGNYFGMPINEAQERTKHLTVIHPLGQVGKLPWQQDGKTGNHFGDKPEPHILLPAALQIRTFTERVTDDALLNKMHQLIHDAERIIYLGFSFLPINMELMTIKHIPQHREVLGTSYGLSTSNTEAAKHSIVNAMGPATNVVGPLVLESSTCNQLLKDYWQAILS